MGDDMPQGAKPDRLYRIGEAARALELKTCVLRFWESEFPQLSPVRTPKGQRLYTEEHLALLRRIRSLLHEQGMTIQGARRVLEGQLSAPAGGAPAAKAKRAPSAAPLPGSPKVPRRSAATYPDLFSAVIPPVAPRSRAACSGDGVLRAAVAELESLRGLLLTTPSPLASATSSVASLSSVSSAPGSAARPEEPEGVSS